MECRFKSRLAVRLQDAGPGPAAGGPVYFRVDAWAAPWYRNLAKTLENEAPQ
jgi:hypothetical protein